MESVFHISLIFVIRAASPINRGPSMRHLGMRNTIRCTYSVHVRYC